MDYLPPACLALERATPADEDNADDDDRGSDGGRGLQAHLLDDVAAYPCTEGDAEIEGTTVAADIDMIEGKLTDPGRAIRP